MGGAHGERQTAFSTCFEKADGFRVVLEADGSSRRRIGFSDHSSAPSAGASFAVAVPLSFHRCSFPIFTHLISGLLFGYLAQLDSADFRAFWSLDGRISSGAHVFFFFHRRKPCEVAADYIFFEVPW